MTDERKRLDALKQKLRKLKQLERKLRFNGAKNASVRLIWESFFNLQGENRGKAKYSLNDLAVMTHDEYKAVVDEYFAFVYFELYKENGILCPQNGYDPAILTRLGLTVFADEQDIKKRFRELAKKYHPDTGGDGASFIKLMEDYKRLTGY